MGSRLGATHRMWSQKDKLQIVLLRLEQNIPTRILHERFGVNQSLIYVWCKLYLEQGEDRLRSQNGIPRFPLTVKNRKENNMNAKSTKDGKDTRVLDKLIGNWIHYRRKQAGYSQLELAKAVGLSQQHLAHVEAGNRSMSLYGLLNMRNVLNFTIGELEHYIDNLGVEITMVTLDDLIDIQHWSIHLSEKELTSAIQEQRVYALKTPWELVGICCFDVFRKEPTLRYLFVDPNYRKQGYGKKLILSWENVMREQGFTSILTIISENDNIKYFFEKLGYQYVGFIQSRARKSEDVMYRQYLSSE